MTELPDMTACLHWYPAALLAHGRGRALQCEGCLIRDKGCMTHTARQGERQSAYAGRLKLKLQRPKGRESWPSISWYHAECSALTLPCSRCFALTH